MYSDRVGARNADGHQESLASSNSATHPKSLGLIAYLRSVPPVLTNRLRDAAGVTKALLAVCFAAVTAGPVLAGYRAYELGLRPVGDTAMMALKVLDVGTANTPLIGQQTSVVDSAVRHPGPLQFWLYAPFVRIFGVQVGFAIGTALVAAVFSIIAVWVAHRIGGARFAVVMTVGVVSLHTMFGFVLLASPVSSAHGLIPSFAALVCAAAVLRGDLRLLPLTAAVASYAFQTHLAMLPFAMTIAVVVVAGLLIHLPRSWSADRLWASLKPVGRALDISLLLWVGPIVDQLFGYRNLSYMVRLGAAGTDELGRGGPRAKSLVDLVVPPEAAFTRHFTPLASTLGFQDSLALGGWFAWIALGAIGVAALLLWRRFASAQIALTALLAVAACVFSSSKLSERAELKANNYAWIWIVGVLLSIAVVHWIVEGLIAMADRSNLASIDRMMTTVRRPKAGIAALVGVALVAAVAQYDVATCWPVETYDKPSWSAELGWSPELNRAAGELDQAYEGKEILLRPSGFWSSAFVIPTIALSMEELGHPYKLDVSTSTLEAAYGPNRITEDRSGVRILAQDDASPRPETGQLIGVLLNLDYVTPNFEVRLDGVFSREPWKVTTLARTLRTKSDLTTEEQVLLWALDHPEYAELLNVADELRSGGYIAAADSGKLTRDSVWNNFRGGRVVRLWRLPDSSTPPA